MGTLTISWNISGWRGSWQHTVVTLIKVATKLYSKHYSCVVINLLNAGLLIKLAFSTDSFQKPVFFCLSEIFVFSASFVELDISFTNILILHNHCLQSDRCQVLCFLSHLLEALCQNRYPVIKIWVQLLIKKIPL